jgi:hypothetical protein
MVSLATRGDIGARDVLGKRDFRQLTLLGTRLLEGADRRQNQASLEGEASPHCATSIRACQEQLFVLRVASSTTFEVHSSALEADIKLLASAAARFLFVSGGALLLKVCRGSERQD